MRAYLDHNATTPLHPAAAEVLRAHANATTAANPSSIHSFGQAARAELSDARRRVAVHLGVAPDEIVFTASGTEANLVALRGALGAARDRRRVLVSAIEHASVLTTLETRATERPDLKIERLPVTAAGLLDLDAAAQAMGPDVLLTSLMLANNETGARQPVRELALLSRSHGSLVHCDAAQAIGKVPIDTAALGVDLLTFGGHKVGAGFGCGVLFLRRGSPLSPVIPGHQERGLRGGTENVAAIAAAAAALDAQLPHLAETAARVGELRDRLEHEVCERIDGVHVNGSDAPRLPNTSNLRFDGADGEALLIALDLAGIAVSTGAACASGTLEPSHVLLAMGLSRAQAKSSVRFSLGAETTNEEIDLVLRVLPDLVRQVRAHAPPA